MNPDRFYTCSKPPKLPFILTYGIYGYFNSRGKCTYIRVSKEDYKKYQLWQKVNGCEDTSNVMDIKLVKGKIFNWYEIDNFDFNDHSRL